jgi:hypothetical protein
VLAYIAENPTYRLPNDEWSEIDKDLWRRVWTEWSFPGQATERLRQVIRGELAGRETHEPLEPWRPQRGEQEGTPDG